MMRLVITTFVGVVLGFFFGVSFPTLSVPKVNPPPSLTPSIHKPHVERKYIPHVERKYSGLSAQALLEVFTSLKGHRDGLIKEHSNETKIWIPTNPRGAESLPTDIIVPESDYHLRRIYGEPSEDFTFQPKYLVAFTVGYDQRNNIDLAVKKFSENFTILLFHYDGRTSEWDEFEWSNRAIHVSGQKQTKWWYAKRFLHPDIVSAYDYIFIWDEDLGLENFDAEEYIRLVRKHGLDISQPGLDMSSGMTWAMTMRRDDTEVHKETEERPGWCIDPHLPPCAAFVEIMATVFSRSAWRCVWHIIQNDLVHGWGLDFVLRKCVETPAHEHIGVVDAQWIIHQTVPSLGNQGQIEDGREPWEGVRDRCRQEWAMFQDRVASAETEYYKSKGMKAPNFTRQGEV